MMFVVMGIVPGSCCGVRAHNSVLRLCWSLVKLVKIADWLSLRDLRSLCWGKGDWIKQSFWIHHCTWESLDVVSGQFGSSD